MKSSCDLMTWTQVSWQKGKFSYLQFWKTSLFCFLHSIPCCSSNYSSGMFPKLLRVINFCLSSSTFVSVIVFSLHGQSRAKTSLAKSPVYLELLQFAPQGYSLCSNSSQVLDQACLAAGRGDPVIYVPMTPFHSCTSLKVLFAPKLSCFCQEKTASAVSPIKSNSLYKPCLEH